MHRGIVSLIFFLSNQININKFCVDVFGYPVTLKFRYLNLPEFVQFPISFVKAIFYKYLYLIFQKNKLCGANNNFEN